MGRARRNKKVTALALVAGSLSAAGLLANGASALPCLDGGYQNADCASDPAGPVNSAVSDVSGRITYNVGVIVRLADQQWRAAGVAAEKNGLPNPGTVSVPTVGGGLPPIGPVGPTPVGDGVKKVKDTIDGSAPPGRVPNGGDVGVPTVGGGLPPIGPVGPVPVGDDAKRIVDPIINGGGPIPSADEAELGDPKGGGPLPKVRVGRG